MAHRNDHVGSYILEQPLGQGGFGQVWLARHCEWADRTYAVKIPTQPDAIRALRKDGHTIAALRHPGIVEAVDFRTDTQPPFLAMEYVPGMSLRELLGMRQRLSLSDTLTILSRVADALAHAHSKGVVHGDIKPENVLIHEWAIRSGFKPGTVKLTDFGLASTIRRDAAVSVELTRHSVSAPGRTGTLEYMSPESREGAEPCPQDDVFALGVLLFEILSGTRPFGHELPSTHQPDLPGSVDELFRHCYARKSARLRDAGTFHARLETIATEMRTRPKPKAAVPPPPPPPTAWRVSLAPIPSARPTRSTVPPPIPGSNRGETTPPPSALRRFLSRKSYKWSGTVLAMLIVSGLSLIITERQTDRTRGNRSADRHFSSSAVATDNRNAGLNSLPSTAAEVAVLQQAAEGGDSKAMVVLGTMYAEGRGVAQSDSEAVRWYLKAADAGFAVAASNLAELAKQNRGGLTPRDEARWRQRAQELGN